MAIATKEQIKAFLGLIETIREMIEVSGPQGIPAGHLYAMVMPHNISLEMFEKCVGILVEAKRVTRGPMHLLRSV